MMEILEYREGERKVLEKNGDYWKDGLLGKSQLPGIFVITDQRIAFRCKALLGAAKQNEFELERVQIKSVGKCNIGPGPVKFIPTGVKIEMNDGSKYIASVTGRTAFMDALS